MTAVDKELKEYFENQEEKKKVELRKTKVMVEEVLEDNGEARGNDNLLIAEVIFEATGFRIPEDVIKIMPKPESITRCRRKLNEEGLFMSDKQIADKRKANAEEVKEWSQE